MSLFRACLGVLVVAGCAADDVSVGQVEQQAGCASWVCGTNSPVIDYQGFHELHVQPGVENAEGFAFTKFEKAGTLYELTVQKGRIYGRSAAGSIYGAALQGARIFLTREGRDYAIMIKQVSSTAYYANTGAPTHSVETYRLHWGLVVDGTVSGDRNLCSEPSIDKIDALGMPGDLALVFEGDRISGVKKTVQPTVETDWFNIGCAGHALSKMHLMGHTHAAISSGFDTTRDERQALLKMLTADYCGNGKSYTVPEMPLSWMDDHDWMHHLVDPKLGLEARWTADGATCLNRARADVNSTPVTIALFGPGKVRDLVVSECGRRLPYCDDDGVDVLDDNHLVSANPAPPPPQPPQP